MRIRCPRKQRPTPIRTNQTGCRIPIRGNLMRNLILTVPQIGVRNLMGKSAPIPHGTHPLPQHNRPMVWKPKPVRASDLAVDNVDA